MYSKLDGLKQPKFIASKTCSWKLIAAWLIITKICKQVRCLPIGECIAKRWHIHTIKYCLAIKKRAIKTQKILLNGKWIFLGEKSQSEKAAYCMTILRGNFRANNFANNYIVLPTIEPINGSLISGVRRRERLNRWSTEDNSGEIILYDTVMVGTWQCAFQKPSNSTAQRVEYTMWQNNLTMLQMYE